MRSAVHRAPARLVAAVVVAAAALAAALGAAGPAAAVPTGVYSVPYSSQLYYHQDAGSGRSYVSELTMSQWAATGFRAPTPAPTQIVRLAWSPVVYAVTTFDATVLTKALTPTEWQRAGFPAPRTVAHLDGTRYVTFWGEPELYAVRDGYAHLLTPAEWAAAGHPVPQPLVTGPSGEVPFLKLSWSPGIAAFYDDGTELLSFESWTAYGQPQPWTLPMLPGDGVCFAGGETIHYDGATFAGPLTLAQWQAAGSPMPDSWC